MEATILAFILRLLPQIPACDKAAPAPARTSAALGNLQAAATPQQRLRSEGGWFALLPFYFP